jgi:diguanylate cyclase (GGDEF)-like protein/PAS domain S-box-containing protein
MIVSLLAALTVVSLLFAWRASRRALEALRRLDAAKATAAALAVAVESQRQATEPLRASEERYALAARGANDGLWDWNLGTGELYYSDRWAEMVGAGARPLAPTAEEWFSRVHPTDLPQLKLDIAAQASGTRSHFLSEHRLQHADGYTIWVLCRGIVVRDAEGRPLRIAGSMTDITPRKDLEDRLRRDAQFDTLTALPNRGYATDILRRVIARAQRNKDQQFAVLFLDCDHFKMINDSMGHHAGDAVLRVMAGRLSTCVRPGDVVARLGGDEFVVILEGVRDEDEAVVVAQRIQDAIALPFYLDGRELFMSVSMGIAMHQPTVDRAEDYLRDADQAMYRAKTGGRARHAMFRPEMRSSEDIAPTSAGRTNSERPRAVGSP